MKCFKGFIGIKGGCADAPFPASGLYIEDLPGMTIKNLAHITSEAYVSANAMVQRKMELAGDYLLGKVLDGIKDRLTIYSHLQRRISGEFTDTVIPAQAGLYGIKMYKTPSALTELQAMYFSFRPAENGSAVITVSDGIVSKNFTVNFLAGEIVQQEIDMVSFQKDITIKIDTTALSYYQASVKAGCGCDNDTLYFTGLTPTGVDHASPFTLDGAVKCSAERMMCMLKQEFKFPLLYVLGIELLKESAGGDRLGFFSIHKDSKEQIAEWTDFVQSEIETKTEQAFLFLQAIDNGCTSCNGGSIGWARP